MNRYRITLQDEDFNSELKIRNKNQKIFLISNYRKKIEITRSYLIGEHDNEGLAVYFIIKTPTAVPYPAIRIFYLGVNKSPYWEAHCFGSGDHTAPGFIKTKQYSKILAFLDTWIDQVWSTYNVSRYARQNKIKFTWIEHVSLDPETNKQDWNKAIEEIKSAAKKCHCTVTSLDARTSEYCLKISVLGTEEDIKNMLLSSGREFVYKTEFSKRVPVEWEGLQSQKY